jgi:endonuclease YncB( thermonuclease family)
MGVQSIAANKDAIFEVLSSDTIVVSKNIYTLKGIDTPELGQKCKCCNSRDYDCRLIAKAALKNLTAGPTIKCSGSVKREFYMIGSCEAGGFDLSRNIGLALSTKTVFRW